MSSRLAPLVAPTTTALLTQECQKGVIGPHSVLPELGQAARDSGMLANVAALVRAARASEVAVIHAVAGRRPDGKGASTNARLFRATERNPVHLEVGTPMVEVVDEIGVDPSDIVSTRLHGLSPIAGTDVGPILRNLGCRTVVVVGVSTNVAIPNAVFDAVNQGFEVVVPRDAIAGVPADYADVLVRNTLSLVATIVTSEELLSCWR